MPDRLTDEAAIARLLQNGYAAQEEYPGSTTAWRARHMKCGQEVTVRLDQVSRGHMPRDSCRCYLKRRAAAEERAKSTRATENAVKAVAGMAAAGWQPLEPYPGSHNPWRCRCMDCGPEGSPSFHNVSQNAGKSKQCRTRTDDYPSPRTVPMR